MPAMASRTPRNRGDVLGSVRQAADDEQVQAEQEQPGGPDVVERVDLFADHGLQLAGGEGCEVLVVAEQARYPDKPADGDQEDSGEDEPQPCREQGDAAVDRAEHPVQGPGDDDVERDHREQAHDRESERALGLHHSGGRSRGMTDISRLFGVTRQRVSTLVQEPPD